MSELPEPVQPRIGDAERDQAAGLLREHLAAGRLTAEEFDERLTRALTARTSADLEPLFRDLPGPKPDLGAAAVSATPEAAGASVPESGQVASRDDPGLPVSPRTANALAAASAIAWPLTILLCFLIGWEYWWLLFIPISLSSYAGSVTGRRHGHGHGHR